MRDQELIHPQTMQRKFNRSMDFAGTLRLRGRESFEVNNQDLWRSRDEYLLGRHSFTLAVWTFPDLIAAQHLLLAVTAKTLIYIRGARSGYFHADAIECLVRSRRLATRSTTKTAGMLPSE